MSTASAALGADDLIGRDELSALVCCHEPAYSQFLHGELRSLGFKVHHAATADSAQHRIAVRVYHAIVVLENLEGKSLGENLLLPILAQLPTDERRKNFVVLLCQSFETGDEMNAFARSVDLTINYQDIKRFGELFRPALEEFDAGNRYFAASLAEV